MAKRLFVKGERYRPIVHILKVKKNKPTVIEVDGEEYVLRHKDQYRDKKSRSVKRNDDTV